MSAVRRLSLRVPGPGMHEITREVEEIVSKESRGDGLCTVFIPHTSASLMIQENADPSAVADVFRERAQTLLEMAASARYCYEDIEEIDAKAAKKNLRPVVQEPLQAARDALAALKSWDAESIDETIHKVAESFEITLGKLGQPIRVAVTGGPVSPPIDKTVWLVGQDRTLERLDRALELIKIRAASS